MNPKESSRRYLLWMTTPGSGPFALRSPEGSLASDQQHHRDQRLALPCPGKRGVCYSQTRLMAPTRPSATDCIVPQTHLREESNGRVVCDRSDSFAKWGVLARAFAYMNK